MLDTPLHTTLDGWLSYELFSASGVIVQAGEQHNLLLNSGLDAMATVGMTGIAAFLAVGTGSTPPDVTQTALSAEVARTNAIGVTPTSTGRVSAGVYRHVVEREFSEGQALGNLTEWGLSPGGPGTNLAVRELFRDGNGQPVVVTKDNTQRLRLTYTLEIRVSPVVRTPGAVTIDGVGNLSGSFVLCAADPFSGDLQIINCLMSAYVPTGEFGQSANSMAVQTSTDYRAADYGFSRAFFGEGGASAPIPGSAGAYVPGSYTRQGQLYEWGPDSGNGSICAVSIAINTSNANRVGYVWAFNAGQELVKSNLDRLTLRGPSVSWGRA